MLRRATALLCLAALVAGCRDKPADTAAAATPPAATASPAEAYTLAAQGHGFAVGPIVAANTVYVFFDPACPHCAHLWEQSQPLLPRMKVVWLPVGLLRKASVPQGAAILAASSPATAMAQNEASVAARGPGLEVPKDLSPDLLRQVEANTALFNRMGAESVPFIVYKNARSGQFGTHAGAVDTGELAALAGL
jgi:thiol:disulfide interchange protein DsbG